MQIGNGGTAGSIVGDVINNSLLAFNRADSLVFGGSISGTGGVVKDGAGTLSLNGASTYSGSTIVNSGTLLVNGSLGATAVSIGNGATLGGIGSIAGDVTVGSGATLSPGMSPGTLTVGSLNLSSGSILDYELSIPSVVGGGVNDLVAVNGNLTLDGRLDVTDIGGFGAGTYTLMTYGGALTDRGLAFGFLPGGFGYELASGGGSVRLMVSPSGRLHVVLGRRRPKRRRRHQRWLGDLDGGSRELDDGGWHGQHDMAESACRVPRGVRDSDGSRSRDVHRNAI